ncbi:MAG: hypothetical protein Q9219_006443 [cf. Caloplaca sp. 3 TL-2023]
MSVPSWPHNVNTRPSENGAFNPSLDPNAFMQMNPTAASFDYNAVQNQQYQQHMRNGSDFRNGSPAFQSPMYQTQPVVPTKRPRPRDDNIGASPRQPSGMLPPSRSQTPQQGPYPGFQGAMNSTPTFQTPNPYHRFSNPGSNASLSPSMQNQQYNAQAAPVRVRTVSPSAYSPAVPNFASQASPPPPQSEQSSRVTTPQNGNTGYLQAMSYGGGPNHPYTPPVNPNGVLAQPSQALQQQQQQQQQRMQEMRQRQYLQHMQANNATMLNRHAAMGVTPPSNPASYMSGNTAMGGRMQHPHATHGSMAHPGPGMHHQPTVRPNPHEQFIRTIIPWMQMRGLPFNPHPTAAGRPVNLTQLFSVVIRFGGSRAVTARSQWPMVAQHLQVAPAQIMLAAEEIHSYWQNNMTHYENSYIQNQQQRQRAMQEQARMQRSTPNGTMPAAPNPPAKPIVARPQDPKQSHASSTKKPTKNRYLAPLFPGDVRLTPPNLAHVIRKLRPVYGSRKKRHPFKRRIKKRPLQPKRPRPGSLPPGKAYIQAIKSAKKAKERGRFENDYPRRAQPRPKKHVPLKDVYKNEPTLERHGGLHVGAVKSFGDAIASSRPTMPLFNELGVVDIRALKLSIKSGIRGEVRLALDTLCILTHQIDLDLAQCEDLVDTLLECAEEQIEFLAENTAEVSDAMLINSYEDNLRGALAEHKTFQLPCEYGSIEYDIEHAVDRLVCITTVLRNLSASESNCQQLATSGVVTLMTNVMRYLGTRNMLLRTHKNTIDFTKDVVVFLSNVSQHIDLPGKEEALCILHFLLTFAPSPAPTNMEEEELFFAPYEPSLHCFLPYAVDSFAKLLAKDEPNRSFFRSIFYVDGSASSSCDLLTRAFGFAISLLPKFEPNRRRQEPFKQVIQARGPYVAQGLLAADILVGLIPTSERSLSRAWLASQDGFAANLINMVFFLGTISPPPPKSRHPPKPQSLEADEIYAMVAHRGISVLRKLGERAKASETDLSGLPRGVLPSKESLLGNLVKSHMETSLLRQVFSYADLET